MPITGSIVSKEKGSCGIYPGSFKYSHSLNLWEWIYPNWELLYIQSGVARYIQAETFFSVDLKNFM